VGAVEGFVQIWCLSCEDVDSFVEVAIGGGPGDAVIVAKLGDVALATKPGAAP
jgi:hypothetical protein